MRRAKLGAAVLTLTGLLAACPDPAPPASIVRHEGQADDVPESPATVEPPPTAPPPAPPVAAEPPDPGVPEAPTTTVRVTTTVPAAPRATVTPARAGTGACGGDLPPCSVMNRESGGNPAAIGYGQCGEDDCYGTWQFDPDTARGLAKQMGRSDLAATTPDHWSAEDQNAAARLLWDSGAGCAHWGSC